MARPNPSFSGNNLSLSFISDQYSLLLDGVDEVFKSSSSSFERRFGFLSLDEVQSSRDLAVGELEASTCLSILASVEANFRMDYLNRAAKRLKDPLSQAYRGIYNNYEERASFEEHLLGSWRKHAPQSREIVSELRGALKYRHWLAHGRYWKPQFGRKYDYYFVSDLAYRIEQSFPFVL